MWSLDLFSKPFSLTPNRVLESISDHMVSLSAKRSLILIDRAAVQRMCENLKAVRNLHLSNLR